MIRWLTAQSERTEAAAALAKETPARARARTTLRQLFDAAEDLARFGEHETARATLHRAGLTAAVAGLQEFPEAERGLDPKALAELSASEGATTEALRDGHQRALDLFERDWLRVVKARRALLQRVALLVIGLALGVWGARSLVAWVFRPPDFAQDAPWVASSKAFDCHPKSGECGGSSTNIFFHTNHEPNPWLRIDLQTPRQFSWLSIVNRLDSLQERAVPLVVEVSDDGSTFRPVARRDDTFTTWEPHFEPTTARYVRLRVEKSTALHLEKVGVHP